MSGDVFGRGMEGATARPSSLPQVSTVTETNVRCWRCEKLLAEQVTRPWQIKCGRCKARNKGGARNRADQG